MKALNIEALKEALKKALDDKFSETLDYIEIDADNLNDTGGDTITTIISEHLQTWVSEQQVIYYSVAIKYLSENDPSLNESIELAIEHGIEDLNTINSELLATLHQQQALSELIDHSAIEQAVETWLLAE